MIYTRVARSPRWLVPALLLTAVVLCLLRGYGGLFGLTIYSHDAFALLDPAWRLLNGQRPHIDFYSQIGPLPYLQTLWGFKFSHDSAEGMVYGQIGFGAAAALWAFFLARTRLRLPLACLASLYVLLLAIAPFNVGDNFTELTPGMLYNRSGYVLVFLVLLETLSSPARSGRADWAGGLSTGAALALAFFTKSTYFLAGALVLLASFPLRKQAPARWAGIAAAFTAISLGFLAFLRFDLASLARDLRMMSGAKYINPAKFLSAALELVSVEGLAFAVFVLFAVVIFRRQNEPHLAIRTGLAAAIVALAGALLLFSNKQDRGLPLNAAMEILIAERILQGMAADPVHDLSIRRSLVAAALLLTFGAMAPELAGIPYAAFERITWKSPPFASPVLQGFRIREEDYAALVNDGLALAQRYRRPDDTIVSLDFSDFFSYALQIKPAKGGANSLHYKNTFSDAHHPTPERLFGAADIVMVPIEYSEVNSKTGISRNYLPYLRTHFHLEAQSPLWQLYRRNS